MLKKISLLSLILLFTPLKSFAIEKEEHNLWVRIYSGITFTEEAKDYDFFKKEENRVYVNGEYSDVLPLRVKKDLYKFCDETTCFNFHLTKMDIEETINSYAKKNKKATTQDIIENIKNVTKPEVFKTYVDNLYHKMKEKDIKNEDLKIQYFHKHLPINISINESVN